MSIFLRRLWFQRGNVVAVFKGHDRPVTHSWTEEENETFLKPGDDEVLGPSSATTLLLDDSLSATGRTLEGDVSQVDVPLNVREIAHLSLHFSMLWVSGLYIGAWCKKVQSADNAIVCCKSRSRDV